MINRHENNRTTPAAQRPPREPAIEGFLPTDYFPQDTAQLAKKRRRRRFVLVAVLALLAAMFAAAGVYWHRLKSRPADFFVSASPSPTAAPTPTAAAAAAVTPPPTVTATPTPDPFAVLGENDGPKLEQNIVNILLIGADYAEERETWRGKDGLSATHADVMIVLAVNFDENTADLISLPRDTYTTIPGVSGIYKLNASLDCGGGILAENGAGFEKVCEAASFLLGGIPVDYYYAVTMPAVKQLVDAIGGVDYKLDVSFEMQGRRYSAGRRHLDGQGVLDYLRVRKESSGLEPGQTGDARRVQRQKKMLLAIFDQLKAQNMMMKVPEILEAFEGQLFTNCTASQTAALALYGYNMPSENISMYSMTGEMHSMYSWNFSFIKQAHRQELIQQIYGVEVPQLSELTYAHAQTVYQTKIANQYLNTCGPLTKYVAALLEEDDKRPLYTPTPSPTPAPTAAPQPTPTPGIGETPAPTDAAAEESAVPASAPTATPVQKRKYTQEQRNIYEKYLEAIDKCRSLRGTGQNSALRGACSKLQTLATRLASTFKYDGKLTWTIPPLANTNEIYVDFR